MKRRILSSILACLISLSVCTNVIHAKPSSTTSSLQEVHTVVDEQLRTFNDFNIQQYQGLIGILYNMRNIVNESIYVHFMDTNDDGKSEVGYDAATLKYQQNKLINFIKRFNETYESDNKEKGYIGVTIDKEHIDKDDVSAYQVNKDVADYMAKVMDGWIKDYGTTDDGIKKLKSEHKRELRYMYEIINTATESVNRLRGLIPVEITYNDSGVATEKPIFEYKPAIDTLTNLSSNEKYKKILDAGKKISESEIKSLNLDKVDESQDLLKQFFKNGNVDGGQLTNVYWECLATSAIYEPFVSKIGDDNFTRALKVLSGDKSDDSQVLRFYNRASTFLKPVYVRETDHSGKPTGVANRLTLKDFIERVQEDRSGALVLPKGTIKKEADSNSYQVYDEDRFKSKGDGMKGYKTTTVGSTDDKDDKSKDDKSKDEKSKDNAPKEKETDSSIFPLDNQISNEANMTSPVFKFGTYNYKGKLELGTLVAKNIFQNCTKIKDFEQDNRLLFMNAFGDLVTEDGTVVIPGSANPSFTAQNKSYYPYTVAFMKYYPNINVNDIYFRTLNDKSDGKFVIVVSQDKQSQELTPGDKYGVDTNAKFSIRQLSGNKSLDLFGKYDMDYKIQGSMRQYGEGDDYMIGFKQYKFKSGLWNLGGFWDTKATEATGFANSDYEAFLVKTLATSFSNDSMAVIFDSNLQDLSDKDIAMIANNYLWSILQDKDGNMSDQPNDRMNVKLLAQEVIPEALNGLNNPQAYTKNMLKDYDAYVDDSANRFSIFIMNICKPLLDTFGKTNGVLGLLNCYQDPIFGKIVSFGQTYMWYIMICIIILVIAKYMRMSVDILYALFVSLAAVALTWVFIYILPVMLPTSFNALNNIFAKDLSYTTLIMKAENYKEVYTDRYDKSGRLLMSTTSVNIFKLNDTQLEEVCDKLNITKAQALSGSSYAINPDAGVFLEGNVLKVNVDKLFRNNPITGKYVKDGGTLVYKLESEKMVSSCIDYYTPYQEIVDNFTDQLNKFSTIYQLNRNVLIYNGMTKDSFMVNAFMYSPVFLAPDDWDKVKEITDPRIMEQLEKAYPNPYDFLGIQKVIANSSKEKENSLWYKTLQQNEWLDDDKSKAKLISYVNFNVKKFMLDNREKFQNMSDENIIKVVSLYATTLLDQRGGDYFNELYPMYLNYEELNLGDILLSVYTTNYDRFSSDNMSIIQYITATYNWLNLIVFIIDMILQFVLVNVVKLLVPVLYLLLAIILLIRFIVSSETMPLLKGYLKSSLIIFACYTVHCLSLGLTSLLAGNAFCIWFQFAVDLLLTEILIRLVFAILFNITELGNRNINNGWVKPFALSAVQKLGDWAGINSMFASFKHKEEALRDISIDRYRAYQHDSDIDDIYGSSDMGRVLRTQHRHAETGERFMDNDGIFNEAKEHDLDDYDNL